MTDALVKKLEHFVRLSSHDKEILARAAAERVRKLGSHEPIVLEGDKPAVIYLVLDGWACRYKHLEDGRRQIVSFFLPGDLCDLNVFILREMDHSIASLGNVTVAEISRPNFEAILEGHSRIAQALWWDSLVTIAIQREWTVNLGQRDALERVAHLFCELFIRLRTAGQTRGKSCDFPVTQTELADATGMSTVHVNRTLQELRNMRLINLANRTLTIHDLSRLMQTGLFNPNYLHLDHEGAHLDANE
ncbi:Crp/Fnr family transcriptional regulator [Mesorhizobium sp. B1-1-8]|uniref:Crp/Fnr family transcriptional regulator n=1 Tax=Mesorhizobium sp. B1-1-8 TaxID=2589976 RepID=UPI00112A5AF6|nr:Crp/Fnr family transcriptional regulator [Mesorhizobium sp. B1-1-8]UCI06312.1 Crp/Fnr family transcriptional regulator [Mesorhizobium sp. B1-1-8]